MLAEVTARPSASPGRAPPSRSGRRCRPAWPRCQLRSSAPFAQTLSSVQKVSFLAAFPLRRFGRRGTDRYGRGPAGLYAGDPTWAAQRGLRRAEKGKPTTMREFRAAPGPRPSSEHGATWAAQRGRKPTTLREFRAAPAQDRHQSMARGCLAAARAKASAAGPGLAARPSDSWANSAAISCQRLARRSMP